MLASNGYYSRWRLNWHLRFVFSARISPSLQIATSGFDERIVVWLLAGLNCWTGVAGLTEFTCDLWDWFWIFFGGSETVVGRDRQRWWHRANLGDGSCGVLGYLFILGNLFLIGKKNLKLEGKKKKSRFNYISAHAVNFYWWNIEWNGENSAEDLHSCKKFFCFFFLMVCIVANLIP